MTEKTIEYWSSRPEVYEMPYKDFYEEYSSLLPIMAQKEGNGHLDFHKNDYVPMTDEEIALHEKDWRAFSRLRGYSEYDIAEYGRWHKLTGQTDKLKFAINDHWRRPVDPVLLYLRHLETAMERGITLSDDIKKEYTAVKNKHDEESDSLFLGNPLRKKGDTQKNENDFDDGWTDNDWEDWDKQFSDDNPTTGSESKQKYIRYKLSSLRKRTPGHKHSSTKLTLATWHKIRNRGKNPID